MKNLEPKQGWKNRHIDGLPPAGATIRIISMDLDKGEHVCTWNPFDPSKYQPNNMPAAGFLGSATTPRIGFNLWEQNDYEFVYYQIL